MGASRPTGEPAAGAARASLRQRLRRPTAQDITGDDDERRLLAAKAGLYMYLAGALLATLGLLAAAPGHPVSWVQIAGAGVAYAMAGIILALYDRFAWWMAHGSTGISTVITTSALAVSPAGALDPAHLFLLWNVAFAFFFYSRRAAWAQLAFVGAAFAVVLRIAPGDADPVGTWAVLMGTFGGAGVLIRAQQARLAVLTEREAGRARIDHLTGLPNRRAFVEALERMVACALRDGEPFALLLGDVDHFKQLNDRLGHQEGDAALCRVARALDDASRAGDVVARWGGEEFAVLAPAADGDEAWVIAERLRTAVAATASARGGPLTMSFGVAVLGVDGGVAAELEHSADAALYRAKGAGRDRTELARASRMLASPV